MEIFFNPFMLRAFAGAIIVGVCAPAVGVFLVQKKMSLIGDGLGHVALTGVAFGFLTGMSPIWTTLVVTALGAVAIEIIRQRGKASGDAALALLFYGGIAGGVFLTALVSGKSNANLQSYLFGALLTVNDTELLTIGILGAVLLLLMLALRPWLAAICHDEEHAIVSGLPVKTLNLLLSVIAAVTVSVAMRAVGLLLVSALMVVPVVTAQQMTRSFARTMGVAMVLGLISAGVGVFTAGVLFVPPGASVVLAAILLFMIVLAAHTLWASMKPHRREVDSDADVRERLDASV